MVAQIYLDLIDAPVNLRADHGLIEAEKRADRLDYPLNLTHHDGRGLD